MVVIPDFLGALYELHSMRRHLTLSATENRPRYADLQKYLDAEIFGNVEKAGIHAAALAFDLVHESREQKMSYSGQAALQENMRPWCIDDADADLACLCERIRTADATDAKVLPVQILTYMAKIMGRVEIDIHVEECLPMVCDAAHSYLRSMGTFSSRFVDLEPVDACRERLIQSLEILADEVGLCKPLA